MQIQGRTPRLSMGHLLQFTRGCQHYYWNIIGAYLNMVLENLDALGPSAWIYLSKRERERERERERNGVNQCLPVRLYF